MSEQPLVGVIMGSTSDWETMRYAVETLAEFGVPHEAKVVSAHRTPQLMAEYAQSAEARGLQVIIAGAGGAAHLPGMVAAQTVLPVLGVVMVVGETIGMIVTDSRLMARHRHARKLLREQVSSDL